MYTRYILRTAGPYGFWATGTSRQEILSVIKKHRMKIASDDTVIVDMFTSDFAFAPYDRTAENGEADAYITADGYTSWKDCNREEVFEGSFDEFRESDIF